MENDWKLNFLSLLQQPLTESAFALKTQLIPDKLYKYISTDYLKEEKLSALKKDKIWVANPETMNDPFDSGLSLLEDQISNHLLKENFESLRDKAGLDKAFVETEMEQIKSSPDILNKIAELIRLKFPEDGKRVDEALPFLKEFQSKYFEQIVQGFNSKLHSSIKISCFSEVFDSLLLWSHYANSHKGICIEYHYGGLESGDLRRRLLYPVIYSTELFDATAFLTDYKNNAPLIALMAAMHKSRDWSYEKEWRLIIPGGIIQHDSLFSAAPVSAVYLGCRISHADEKLIREVLGKKNIPLFQMRMQPGIFALIQEPII